MTTAIKDTLNYSYQNASSIEATSDYKQLFLSDFSEIREPSRFFFGQIVDSFTLSRCLLVLSNTVQSSFSMSPFEMAKLKDPIVTVGNATIRFEGFSHCAGVYVRTDVVSGGFRGEMLANGTTNVDFNQPMISALGGVSRNDDLNLSIGKDDVQVKTGGKHIIERKVPLPTKWIKGLTSVQHYLSLSDEYCTLTKVQALQLFRSIPKGTIKNDYYLIKRGNKYQFSPVQSQNAIVIGGLHRLQLLQPLLPLITKMKVFAQQDTNNSKGNKSNNQSVTFQLYFDAIILSFSLSRDAWRGFSGEGALLEELLEDIPHALIESVSNTEANADFNQVTKNLRAEQSLAMSLDKIDNISAKLSAMGLLGYALDSKQFFYRQLPFKLSRILSLNPRLKGVEKLLENNKVNIISNDGVRVEAQVEGSGVMHTVILDSSTDDKVKQARCTCTWFSQNQGERGACKHILAVKKLVGELI